MINCIIASPKKTMVYKNVRKITLSTLFGQIQILPGHAESFILLREGNIFLKQLNKESEVIRNTNGECYIKNDVVTVIL